MAMQKEVVGARSDLVHQVHQRKNENETRTQPSYEGSQASSPLKHENGRKPPEVKKLKTKHSQKRVCTTNTQNVGLIQHATTRSKARTVNKKNRCQISKHARTNAQFTKQPFPSDTHGMSHCCLCTHPRSHFDRSAADIRDTPLSKVADTMTVCLRMTLIEGTTAPPWTLLPPAGPDLTALALWSNSSTISLTCTGQRQEGKKKSEIHDERK